MNPVERREHYQDPKEELLPEILARLRSCGAEIRASDRQRLMEAEAAKSGEPRDRRRGDRRNTQTTQPG